MDLDNDVVAIEAVKIQESILSPGTQQLVPIASDVEVRARLAALASPWFRHLGPARRLREAVAAIPFAENVPAPGVVGGGSFSEFPQLMSADVVAELAEFSENSAPRCGARYNPPRMRPRICEGDLDEGKPRKWMRTQKKAAAGK
ncbi:uncharacterized protein GLRG_03405 [Colletotrichum graminicola M1.001]|uniref:Uncharacterized protein n=1 Tax=Colletotrichum graminicola (strain M1.001 / M2 / FGSC 10212) TaxID=645133 RepID=E3QC26_COLGM|nr:uncharacterized protein GLRG_03405 [Colletotrichum graminicola M1.001]EFQ28261.1 hypothetical protein GLRG_03405 [Colletotrichum graminicola M1.001]